MKFFRFALNVWITAASLLSFLLGWVALAHSPKPIQPAQTAAFSVPALQPLQELRFGDDENQFQGFQAPNTLSQRPVFRSGGS